MSLSDRQNGRALLVDCGTTSSTPNQAKANCVKLMERKPLASRQKKIVHRQRLLNGQYWLPRTTGRNRQMEKNLEEKQGLIPPVQNSLPSDTPQQPQPAVATVVAAPHEFTRRPVPKWIDVPLGVLLFLLGFLLFRKIL